MLCLPPTSLKRRAPNDLLSHRSRSPPAQRVRSSDESRGQLPLLAGLLPTHSRSTTHFANRQTLAGSALRPLQVASEIVGETASRLGIITSASPSLVSSTPRLDRRKNTRPAKCSIRRTCWLIAG